MNRNNLIDQIAARTQRSKADAEQTLDAVLDAVADALANGEKVDLRGFGSFQVSGKKERQGRNPRTGEMMTIPAKNVAVFRPGKELADRVSGAAGQSGASEEAARDDSMPRAQLGQGSAKVHGDKIDV